MHDEGDIIELAQQIQNADKQLKNTTCHKLGVIMDQVKYSIFGLSGMKPSCYSTDQDAASPGHGNTQGVQY